MSLPKRRGVYVNTYRDPRSNVYRADVRLNADDVGGGFTVRGTAAEPDHPSEALARAASAAHRMLLDPSIQSSMPAGTTAKLHALRLLAQAAKNGSIHKLVRLPSLTPSMRHVAHQLERQNEGRATLTGHTCVLGADDDGYMGPSPWELYQQGPWWDEPSAPAAPWQQPQMPAPSQQPTPNGGAMPSPSDQPPPQPQRRVHEAKSPTEEHGMRRAKALSSFTPPKSGWQKASSDRRAKAAAMGSWGSFFKKALSKLDHVIQSHPTLKQIVSLYPPAYAAITATHAANELANKGAPADVAQKLIAQHLDKQGVPDADAVAERAVAEVAKQKVITGAGVDAARTWPGGTGRGTWADYYWDIQRRRAGGAR